jgi:hypothetical protein
MDYQQSYLLGRILFPGWMFGKQEGNSETLGKRGIGTISRLF